MLNYRTSETTAALSTAQLVGFLEEDPADACLQVFEQRGHIEHQSPAHALAFAVLLDALDELVKTPVNRRRYLRYQETFAWFMSDDRRHPLYFVNLCDHFGFDPAVLREQIGKLLVQIAADPARQRVIHLRPRRAMAYSRQRQKIGSKD